MLVLDATGARLAAAVIFHRSPPEGKAEGIELLMVKRNPQARFFPDTWTFPGGKLDEADQQFIIDFGTQAGGVWGDDELALAALREVWEELGLTLIEPLPTKDQMKGVRKVLLEGVPLAEAFEAQELSPSSVRPVPMTGAGLLKTPPFHRHRFSTRFYASPLPWKNGSELPDPELWGEELAALKWWRPAEILERWDHGKAPMPPPIRYLVHQVETLGLEDACRQLETDLSRTQAEWFLPRFSSQVAGHPVASETLPPARHTTCWLLGQQRILAVDPGSAQPSELSLLKGQIELLKQQTGGELAMVVLTHHHPDHVAGATAISRHFDVPIAAHPETAAIIVKESRVEVDLELYEGDGLETSNQGSILTGPQEEEEDPFGQGSLRSPQEKDSRWEVLHTPGHSPGHICLWQAHRKWLVCGDMVSGLGWVQVRPPRGDMGTYMASLKRMQALEPTLLFPGHGSALPAKKTLHHFYTHRLEREAKVITALSEPEQSCGWPSARAFSLEELLPLVYADTDETLWPLAKASLEAHLLKLQADGTAIKEGPLWALRAG